MSMHKNTETIMKAQSDQTETTTYAENGAGIHIFVLIDALGWEYLKGREFLSDLLPYRRPLRTVLGFSSGAIPTILTGAWPAVTGHWNLFYYDPNGSPFWWLKYFEFMPDFIMNHRITGKILEQMGRRLLGLGPGFVCGVSPRLLRWFNWVEKKNIYERGGISGAKSIFDRLGENGIPNRVYTYHHWTDTEIIQQSQTDLTSRAARFYFLYLSEMDMFLHENCADEHKLGNKIAWYDRQLRGVFETARAIDPNVTFTVFSDHGMTPVHNHYDLMKDVERRGFRTPEDYLAVYDSTMARFWFFNDAAKRQITEALVESRCGKILTDIELRDMGVFFDDRRFGEIIYLLHPGWMLAKSDFNGPQWMPVGMHGYHPDDPYSDGVFLTNDKQAVEVRNIADVYHCLRKAAN